MKRITAFFLLVFALLTGCMNLGTPYEGDVHVLTIRAVSPQGYDVPAGAGVSIKGISNSAVYALTTGEDGLVFTNVLNGIYSISVQKRAGDRLLSGTLDKVVVSGENLTVEVDLVPSIHE